MSRAPGVTEGRPETRATAGVTCQFRGGEILAAATGIFRISVKNFVCLSIFICIYLFASFYLIIYLCLSILSICLYLSIYQSESLYPYIYISFYLSLYPSIHSYINLSRCLFTYLCIYLYVLVRTLHSTLGFKEGTLWAPRARVTVSLLASGFCSRLLSVHLGVNGRCRLCLAEV